MIASFRTFISCFLVVLLLLWSGSQTLKAQKPNETHGFEMSPDETIATVVRNNQRINVATGIPIAIYGLQEDVAGNTPEDKARNYLQANQQLLGLDHADLRDLRHHHTRKSQAGYTVRFRQHHEGLAVENNELTISLNKKQQVTFVMNTYESGVSLASVSPNFSAEMAMTTTYDYLNVQGYRSFEKQSLLVYHNDGTSRLAYKVIVQAESPRGEWEVWVDAHNAAIFKIEDGAHYFCPPPPPTDGTATVFNPDPLSSAMVDYDGNYTDDNDATNADLDAQLMEVVLKDITQTGSTYELKGPYAYILDYDGPFKGEFSQDSPDFLFNREEDGFEAANAYYHLDASIRYINEELECDILPYHYEDGVRFDPHGWNGADNSSYSSNSGRLTFGEGCVDDAEDSDVVHHELGHGLHDWVTMGGLSNNEGLSEGFADYWAVSYNRSLNIWSASDPQYNWVFNWDGHNECWNGRITNYGPGYPDGITGGIHNSGQVISTCLMGIYETIGKEFTDKAILEGLGLTNGGATQNDAAVGMYQAAINLEYPYLFVEIIHSGLTGCGYQLPALIEPPSQLAANISLTTATNPEICEGETIDLIVNTENAAGELIYTWDIPLGSTLSGGANMVTFGAGTLTSAGSPSYPVNVTVSDDLGTVEATIMVTVHPSPSVTATASNELTCADETATLFAGSNTTGLQYNWSGTGLAGATNAADVTATQAGTYDLEVTSQQGCKAATTVVVTENKTAPTATIAPADDLNCVVNEVVLDAAQSSSNGNFTYNWQGENIDGNTSLNPTITQAGTYELTVLNEDNGCATTTSITVVNGDSNDPNNQIPMRVVPNPTASETFVELCANFSGNAALDIYTIDGKQVFGMGNWTIESSEFYRIPFNTSSLSSGLYFIRLTPETEPVQMVKFMVR